MNNEWKSNNEMPELGHNILVKLEGVNGVKLGMFTDNYGNDGLRYEVALFGRSVKWDEVEFWMCIPELPKEA